MKAFVIVLWAALVFSIGLVIRADLRADWEYEQTIGSYWSLGVKASTLQLKSQYLDQFVAAVDSAKLTGHNAVIYPTPDNDVAVNIATLKNLQHRMEEIKGMDVTSFQYQQAIAQITAQEQDEAGRMLGVIQGAWYLNHHPFFWGWYGGLFCLFFGVWFLGAVITTAVASDGF